MSLNLSNRARLMCSILASILTSLAFVTPIRIPDWQVAYDLAESSNRFLIAIAKLRIATEDKGLLALILVVFLSVYYRDSLFDSNEISNRNKKITVKISSLIFSFLLSVCMVTGASIKTFNNLDFLVANNFQIVFSSMILIGYWLFFYTGVEKILVFINRIKTKEPDKKRTSKIACLLVDRYPFAVPFIICIICWMPYWIVHWPGSVLYDGFKQLNYFYGVESWSNSHPVFGSLLYGTLMSVGRFLADDNLGVAILSCFHHLLFATVFAYLQVIMKRWLIPRSVRIAVLVFMAIHPMISYWPQTFIKDTTSSPLMLLFAILYLESIRLIMRKMPFTRMLIMTVLIGIVLSLIRHDNTYITVISIFMLLLIKQSARGRMICMLGGIICMTFSMVISYVLVSAESATPGSVREAMSIPFQQTARYIVKHGNDVTPKEREVIDGVLNYDLIAERYDPDLSDPVKALFRGNSHSMSEYFKVWFSMFLKQPITYIEATLNNSYSYYYPDGDFTTSRIVYGFIETNKSANNGYFDIRYSSSLASRQGMLNMLYILKNIPGINVFFHIGVYTWLTLFFMLALFQKKKYVFLLGFAPSLLNILTCIASPVNGNIRYYLPSLLMMPLLLAWSYYGLHGDFLDKSEAQKPEL